MKQDWINKANNDNLIVFFNGWGMDKRIVQNLSVENYDILCIYDYRNIEPIINLDTYKSRYLIAWSMGVYLSQICDIPFDKTVAINGTLSPIDAKYGINPKIYNLTINNFNEFTKKKFAKNMGIDYELDRNNDELKDELIAIKNYKHPLQFNFDKAIISQNDKIFPAKNQINYWEDNNTESILLDNIGHYVFSEFKAWSDIINV